MRDFYFFKRSQYPQLTLLHKKPPDARAELQSQASKLKFVEIGKVMLVWGILKNVTQVVQRVVFLHEDLVKLPSFPRKALETELDLFDEGQMGKVNWGNLIKRKFSILVPRRDFLFQFTLFNWTLLREFSRLVLVVSALWSQTLITELGRERERERERETITNFHSINC